MSFYTKSVFVYLLLLFSLNLFAQKEIPVLQLKVTPLVPVYNPVLFDSIDVNRETFETKNLLKTQIDFQTVRNSRNMLEAGADSIFKLEYAPYDSKIPARDKAVQLLAFSIDADRYCRAELKIVSTDRLEVYVNNQKKKSKETKEDSLSKAQPLTIDLTLEPRQYEVIIKRLTEVKNFNETQLKLSVKPEKKDSLAEIGVSIDTKRRATINDILEGNRLRSGSLSPSGQYFIFTTMNVFPGGKSTTEVELRELKTNKKVCSLPAEIFPQWVKGKDQFIYSKAGQDGKNLFLFDVASLNETRIAENLNFDYFVLSPDARFLLLSVTEKLPEDKGNLKRVLSPSDRSGAYRGRQAIYLYSIQDQTMQQIIFGRTEIRLSDIRFDSQKALLLASEEDITHRPFSKTMLLEMDLKTLQLDTLLNDPFISGADYSPDGNDLLISGSGEAFGGIGLNLDEGQISNTYDNQVFIYHLKNKEVEAISKNFNPNILGFQWPDYDHSIYLRAEDKDCVSIYRYDLKTKQYTRLDLPEEIISSFSLADTQPLALFRGENNTNSFRLYAYDLKTKKATLLADPFKEQLDEMALSPVTSWTFTTSDSTTIDGRYYLPYHFDPNKKYPMIVYYYGGTSPTSRIFETTYPQQVYAALGYVVYVVNPSGTTGYGQKFSARHVNAWGKMTAGEIIEGTRKFYREHAFVDSTKVGCIGASYGGFMTQYLQTQTPIFAAAVSHAGISSIASYWGEGYWGYAYSGTASAFSYPWNNPDLYINQSPLFSADKINTPLLLLHGTADTNVPIGESIQMYNALKILGKEVEFIQVQGENHIILDYQKRIEWNKTIYAWFAKWLKGQPEWWDALYPVR
ncbi:peptidase S9 [Bacteroidia bacterium]|nr:peptidase S9 [Bacteroidia bacterium]